MTRAATVTLTFLLALAACRDGALTTPPTAPSFAGAAAPSSHDGRYIVVFRSSSGDVDALSNDMTRSHGGSPRRRFHTALRGYVATLPAAALAAIQRRPEVAYVEPDAIATIVGSGSQTLTSAQWGLDRVDQRALARDNLYAWQSDGAGVEVYIVDTGIRYTHREYAGRAFSFYDWVDDDAVAQDCNGHGTHVAGTVGGTTVGIAKSVTLYAARVLDCSGSGYYSDIIAAIDSITKRKLANPSIPMIGSMSLGGSKSLALNAAVDNSVAAGVVWAVAAGNSNANACNYSPASALTALTVGASTNADARSSFSNWGTCVDLFAPGSSIYSSTFTADNTYASWDGTSMATPHVTGVAALYLSTHPTASASEVNQAVIGSATPNLLTGVGTGSPNLLLYSLLTTVTVYDLAVMKGGTGGGTVTSTPAGINCGADCSESYPTGTSVRLTATPAAGSVFAGWSGSCTGTSTTCTVTMSAARAVTATFNLPPLIHLGALAGSRTTSSRSWSATGTATVHNASHGVVSGATVRFSWTGAATGTGTCRTGSTGACSVTRSSLSNSNTSITFTVTGISLNGYAQGIGDAPNTVTVTR